MSFVPEEKSFQLYAAVAIEFPDKTPSLGPLDL